MSRPLLHLVFATFLVCPLASAQAAKSPEAPAAGAHFEDGLASVRAGDLSKALSDFEAAYAASPHYSVLFNIGQARAGLGQPVEAIKAFEAYLATGGAEVPARRRAELARTIAGLRLRTGQLLLRVEEGAARAWLDGDAIVAEEWSQPIELVVGTHSLLYSFGDAPPTWRELHIKHGSPLEVRLEKTTSEAVALGLLVVRCNVPDVTVELADGVRERTPLAAPLTVRAGPLRVRFARAGYGPVVREVNVLPRKLAVVDCEQRFEPDLPASLSGRVVLRPNMVGATVLLDGAPLRSTTVPIGAHVLRIERAGYAPYETRITVAAARTTFVTYQLIPDQHTLAKERQRSRSRNTALVLGGGSVVSLALGASLLAWNGERFEDWRAEGTHRSESDNVGRAAALQRMDDVALGTVFIGAGLGVAAAWLFLAQD